MLSPFPWTENPLRAAIVTNRMHDWPKNVLTFRQEGRKIRIHTTKGRTLDTATALVYVESINMLEGLTEEEADTFL
jgi:DNA-binding LytR/AlgR family response regulator